MNKSSLLALLSFIAVLILVSCEKDNNDDLIPETIEHNEIHFQVEGTYLGHSIDYSGTYSTPRNYYDSWYEDKYKQVAIFRAIEFTKYFDGSWYHPNYIELDFRLDSLNNVRSESLSLNFRIEIINEDNTYFNWHPYRNWFEETDLVKSENISNIIFDPSAKIISGNIFYKEVGLREGIEIDLQLEASFDIQLYEWL